MNEAGMQQRRDQNPRQTYPLPGSDAETLQLQSPTEQRDEPEHGDKTNRELCSQPEVVAGPLGPRIGGVGRMKLHPVTEYQPNVLQQRRSPTDWPSRTDTKQSQA